MLNEMDRKQSKVAIPAGLFKVLPVEPRIVTQKMLGKLQESGASSDLLDVAERAARKK